MDHQADQYPLQDGPAPPPGTVELISSDNSRQFEPEPTRLVLLPVPSDDPDDPLNWSTFRKCWNYALLTATTACIFSVLSTQPVFWSQMLEELPVKQADLNASQALQLIGTAVGCIIFVPFTRKYGRRPIYILSVAIVAAATLWSAYMNTALEIILSNVLMGLAAATNETATQMSIRDMFFVHQRGSANGVYLAAISAGIFFAPILAGIQASATGWRSSYLTLGLFMAGLLVLFICTFEETKFIVPVEESFHDFDDVSMHEHGLDSKEGIIEYERELSKREKVRQRPPFPRYLRLQLITKTNESLWKTFYYPIYTIWYPQVIFCFLEFASGVCWFVVISSIGGIVFPEPPYNFTPAQSFRGAPRRLDNH
ncbi:hypothetical protein CDD83_6865 [Cordyceps sp. RAO-2017]|nr:hypothetical protein CDD83_6865 [Cordyceps sp. RAO-2017]